MEELKVSELKELLKNWTLLFTYGCLSIYKLGSLRLAIDRNTGEKVVNYVV